MLEAFGLSDPGCARANNEDYYLVDANLGLYLVADGMGGARAGEHASRMAGTVVADYIRNSGESSSEVLLEAIEEANRRVLRAAENDPEFHGMGTTLTVALLAGDKLLLASVGDSRAYRFRDDNLETMTNDQTWVNEVGRKLGIHEDQLKVHPMRHVLTMAVGVSDALRIPSYTVPLEQGDQFLLSSDGLHGVLDRGTISEILRAPGTLEGKCHALVESARRAGGPDNITAVLASYQPDS